jgi:hypothetical protein
LVNEMTEQLKALQSLAKSFGEGNTWAAKLMATVIYVICHDGWGKSRSLLTQLGVRERLLCISTAHDPQPDNLLTEALLLGFRFTDGNVEHFPRFLMPPNPENPFKWIPFAEWWEQPVYCRGNEDIITRKELVLTVRSKDGGGHFDSELSCAKYVNLKTGAGWKKFNGDNEPLPPDPAHLVTVWAIGWELHEAIIEHERQLRAQPKGV